MSAEPRKKPMRRDESKRETRQALLRAGLQEVTERGLDAPSLDSICARAGYTRGAFYVHFRNRKEFMAAVMKEACDEFLDVIVAADEEEISLEEIVRRFGEAIDSGDTPLRRMGMGLPQVLEGAIRLPDVLPNLARVHCEAIERMGKIALRDQELAMTRRDVGADSLSRVLFAIAIGIITLREAGLSFEARDLTRTTARLLQG